ncbi:MKI67 FHA domain-interacting nucleolar phosphoprotein-like [Trichogramma pretiosum]|uniref:MKI67 FHA domain-interacting nucleolar phosphoprotein-like n=1 Tax=Trichogramma pretiosum TaxID=7493 RepID=UPI0006C98A8A|nr:MKI67 FHA domain-interacting nucleolar phosphoprotein-like [Trichogramma pretiosum]
MKVKKSGEKAQSTVLKTVSKMIMKKGKRVKNSEKEELVKKTETSEKPYTRGLVYLGHIPHGFFEEEMREYFKQFGVVTRVRVARSKKTGKSKGYGYIEFLEPKVAEIVADTMKSHVICNRNLKATYIPSEKVHKGFFCGKAWSETFYPKLTNRLKALQSQESPQTEKLYKKSMKKKMSQLSKLEEKLQKAGVKISLKDVVHQPLV